MNRLFYNSVALKKIVWAMAILIGLVYTYFFPEQIETLFITWGVLIVSAIVLTSYVTEWKGGLSRLIQIVTIAGVLGLFGLQVASVYLGILPRLLEYDLFFQWSVGCSAGYIITSLITRSRQLFIAGLATLFLIPLFMMPELAQFTPLLFGISHASLLLILAF